MVKWNKGEVKVTEGWNKGEGKIEVELDLSGGNPTPKIIREHNWWFWDIIIYRTVWYKYDMVKPHEPI